MKSLFESLLDDFEDMEKSSNPRREVLQFLKDNYQTPSKFKVSRKPNDDGLYEVDCSKIINVYPNRRNIESLTNDSFVFVNVQNFIISDCSNLKSLKGTPKEVKNNFYCDRCKNLTSLKEAPEKIEGNFNCVGCDNITSLEGAPKEVGGCFFCSCCKNLKSLNGAPKKVDVDFCCEYCSNLTSLEGAPKDVGRDFNCSNCPNLTSLKGAPKKVGRNFLYDKQFTEGD